MSLFGTDGVRGVANVGPMAPEAVTRLGRAAAEMYLRRLGRAPKMVIGRDTRISGPMLEAALAAGMASAGAEVGLLGVVPTPAVALLTRATGADAGAVVSASHNPFEDNGIKFFGADGFKLSAEQERSIEALIAENPPCPPTGSRVGTIRPVADGALRYVEFLKSRVGLSLAGLRVALDCANGAAYDVGPRVLRDLGVEVAAMGTAPDGVNINDRVGAVHPERLQSVVREHGADLGVALDGDADRSLFVDDGGKVVDGDEILAILAADLQEHQSLGAPVIVGTVMSNLGLELALRRLGVKFVRVPVGDRHVVEEMRRHGAALGGEPSGHIVLLDQHTTGDGLLAALNLLCVIRRSGRRLSQLKAVVRKLPQVVRSVPVSRQKQIEDLPRVQQVLARVRCAMNGRGRVLVRFSGTEPVCRVMVEGEDEGEVKAFADQIAAAIREEIG